MVPGLIDGVGIGGADAAPSDMVGASNGFPPFPTVVEGLDDAELDDDEFEDALFKAACKAGDIQCDG